ncbi:MAG: hypothetical protein AAGD25_04110 [Cyanobacteria bacterium P01_F01_bin.150]
MTLAVGSLLQDDRYQIQTVLNSTDVEIAYQAVHTYLNRPVILKQLLHDDIEWVVSDPPTPQDVMIQLLRLSQCQHPCLGEVLDCFEEDGWVYLVLPTASELTMAQWLQANGPVKPLDMLAHLRSLIDIFDKFHQHDLVYGNLSPQTLHYRTATNEMVLTDFSWRMFITDLLSDRHRLNYSKILDLQRLAYIAYCFLTGDYGFVDDVWTATFHTPLEGELEEQQDNIRHNIGTVSKFHSVLPKFHTISAIANREVEAVISTALYPQTAQLLTPTDWFIALEHAICSGQMREAVSPSTSEPCSSMVFPSLLPPNFNVPHPSSGESGELGAKVLTQAIIEEAPLQADSLAKVEASELPFSEVHDDGVASQVYMDEDIETKDGTGADSNADNIYDTALDSQRKQETRWLGVKRGLPLLLGATSVVAAISGGMVGYVFRTQDIEQLEKSPLFGNEIFGREQEFPPSDQWPGLSPHADDSPTVLFERSTTSPQATQIPDSKAADTFFSDNGAANESPAASRRPVEAVPLDGNGLASSDVIRDRALENIVPFPNAEDLEQNPQIESTDGFPRQESELPRKRPKPSEQTNIQPLVSPLESRINSSPFQSESPRVNELPPLSEQLTPRRPSSEQTPRQSGNAPLSNTEILDRLSNQRPKPLITPVSPSRQEQVPEHDVTDVSDAAGLSSDV